MSLNTELSLHTLFFVCNYVYVYVYDVWTWRLEASDPLELESCMVVSFLAWALGIKLKSSGRAPSVRNC